MEKFTPPKFNKPEIYINTEATAIEFVKYILTSGFSINFLDITREEQEEKYKEFTNNLWNTQFQSKNS
jgi:hypothetical protein